MEAPIYLIFCKYHKYLFQNKDTCTLSYFKLVFADD